MVVTADEHPDLYALLISKPPKTRASILRSHAEFGIWIKRQGAAIPSVAVPAPGIPSEATPAAPMQAANLPTSAKSSTAAIKTVSMANSPDAEPLTGSPEGSMVLDPSMLAGVNFGDLD